METNHIKDGSEHTPSSEDLSKEDDESKKDLIYSEDELLQINQRISLRVYDDESKEFTSLTTYHGMVRIYNSATWPSLIFWCLVVVTCVTLFMIHCGLLLTYYNSHPTFIKETLYNRAHMDVSPTITICKRYFQDPKKVKEYNVTKVAAFFLRGVVAKEFIITNYPAEYREWASYEEQFKERNGFNFSISQYLLDTSYDCEDLFQGAWIGSTYLENICAGRSRKVLTDDGVCWQLASISSESSQQFFSLNVQMHSSKDEIVFGVQRDEIYPNLDAKGLHVTIGKRVIASLTVTNQTYLDTHNWGNCRMNNLLSRHQVDSETFTDREGCIRICKRKQFIQKCDCVPYSFKTKNDTRNTVPECNLKETLYCVRELERGNKLDRCNCPMECHRINYDYQTVSYSQLEPVLANETASIEINWQHSMTKIQRQTKKITAVDLLSLVAGSMGLFLGMSCVTLLEIFMYLFKSVWGMINNARHKSYLESAIGEKVSHYIKHPNEREGSYESIVITHQTPIHPSDKNCNVPKI